MPDCNEQPWYEQDRAPVDAGYILRRPPPPEVVELAETFERAYPHITGETAVLLARIVLLTRHPDAYTSTHARAMLRQIAELVTAAKDGQLDPDAETPEQGAERMFAIAKAEAEAATR